MKYFAFNISDCDLLRCYSCSWSRDDTSRMFECMNGSDLEVTSNSELEAPTSQYISHAQCAQCRKQELYKGGENVKRYTYQWRIKNFPDEHLPTPEFWVKP